MICECSFTLPCFSGTTRTTAVWPSSRWRPRKACTSTSSASTVGAAPRLKPSWAFPWGLSARPGREPGSECTNVRVGSLAPSVRWAQARDGRSPPVKGSGSPHRRRVLSKSNKETTGEVAYFRSKAGCWAAESNIHTALRCSSLRQFREGSRRSDSCAGARLINSANHANLTCKRRRVTLTRP